MTALAAKLRDEEEGAREGASRERRCIASGEVLPLERLIRFVAGPQGDVVADLAATLLGRGLWVSADRALLEKAVAKNLFSRAAKQPLKAAPDLPARVEMLLVRRMQDDLGMARRSGVLILGFDRVSRSFEERLVPVVLVEASDGATDGRRKLLSAAHGRGLNLEVLDGLSATELSLALGRENVIHAALKPGRLAQRLIFDAGRLSGLRNSASKPGGAGRLAGADERHG